MADIGNWKLLYELSTGYAVLNVDKANFEAFVSRRRPADSPSRLNYNPNLWIDSADELGSIVSLKRFQPFTGPQQALDEYSTMNAFNVDIPNALKQFILSEVDSGDTLIIHRSNESIRMKIIDLLKDNNKTVNILSNDSTAEFLRCVRLYQSEIVLQPIKDLDLAARSLAFSLASKKLRIQPEMNDNSLIAAIGQMDNLDLEVNKSAMGLREWYSVYCPEFDKVIFDHNTFCKVVASYGSPAIICELTADKLASNVGISDEQAQLIIKTAKFSVGALADTETVQRLMGLAAKILISMEERHELMKYIAKKAQAIAPCTTILCGEILAARLMAKAGSLRKLAQLPASTIQILGAEKALFRALMTRTSTPKHGIIYHSSFVGMAPLRLKGWIAHRLASKIALAARMDAFSEKPPVDEAKKMKDWLSEQLKAKSEQLGNEAAASTM